MKKHDALLLCAVLVLAGCGKRITVGDTVIKTAPNTEVEYDEASGITRFHPAKNARLPLFGILATLDPEYRHGVDPAGMVLDGKLAEDFLAENAHARFVIPAGTVFSYNKDGKSYVFALDGERKATVTGGDITYRVREFLMFNEERSFTGLCDAEYSFTHDGREIIFIKNDNPVWRATEGLDYEFYSKEFRDKIERDILKESKFLHERALATQFSNHGGYGVQTYFGAWFFVEFHSVAESMDIVPITDEEDVTRNFKAMKLGRQNVSSFENTLRVRFKVSQDDGYRDGTLELIIPSDEVANLRRILEKNETLYLVFRMARFSDFDASGYGIVYYSYTGQQLKELMEEPPS